MKSGLGHILGDFFHKLIRSPWFGSNLGILFYKLVWSSCCGGRLAGYKTNNQKIPGSIPGEAASNIEYFIGIGIEIVSNRFCRYRCRFPFSRIPTIVSPQCIKLLPPIIINKHKRLPVVIRDGREREREKEKERKTERERERKKEIERKGEIQKEREKERDA
jgi:hypothetical protein